MIFSELYSAYYNAVASVLREACRHPLSPDELRRIAACKAFRESVINIEPALREERWQLLKPDGTILGYVAGALSKEQMLEIIDMAKQ